MIDSRLITVKTGNKVVYTCAVYGNQYEKVLEKIADLFGGICHFNGEGYYIKSEHQHYDVSIKPIDKIFLS